MRVLLQRVPLKGTKEESPTQNEIAASFHATIETKAENNTMIIHYKIKNLSGKTKKLTFTSGLEADYIVYDLQGKKVKQYSDEVMCNASDEGNRVRK